MALDITTQDIIIDETTGLQDDDVNPAVSPHSTNTTLQYLLGLDDPGGLASPEVAFQQNFVVASASAGETINSVVLAQNLAGTPFSTTVGVNSGIQTVDGNYVWLFQDATHANVVIGVIGTSNAATMPAATDPLAFSFALISTSATNADMYTVQYVPLLHPDATNPDDRIDLTDHVFASVLGSTVANFSGQNAAPGNHDFYLIDSSGGASSQLLVTGFLGAANATANVSTQGFGVNNQSINPTETLQCDFVTGGNLAAGSASQIQYGSHLDNVMQAGFTINQITPSSPNLRVDIKITALDVTGNEQGLNFYDGSPTTAAPITSVTLTGQSGFASPITVDGTYNVAGNVDVTVSGLGTGIVTIRGLDNITTVNITTSSQMDRLLVTGVDSNEGCDITEFHFSTTTPNAHTEEVGSFINFDDDGPSIQTTGTPPQITVDETALGTSNFGNFAPNFAGLYGADGPGSTTFDLGVVAGLIAGLTDEESGEGINLSKVGAEVQGRTAIGNLLVFTVDVDALGKVTFDQVRSVIHTNASDPNDDRILGAANLVTLTATITDKDGDTAQATLNIGQNLHVLDDGPLITVPPTTTAAAPLIIHVGSGTGTGTSAFGYDLGADDHIAAFYTAGGSDFIDANTTLDGVQLSLTGTVGTTAITNAVVTETSESATAASFHFTFDYDKDPITAGVQSATETGTLSFDKVADTFTITADHAIEGFSLDFFHTSELLAKEPTSNVGHPNIVVEKLNSDDPATPAHEGFFVQFTGNNSSFSFTANGQGSSADTTYNTGGTGHDMFASANETWVSATQSTNGVAGDTIQKGEALTLRFFDHSPGIATEDTSPNQVASGVAVKFDGIGNSEDLMVNLDLIDFGADGVRGGTGLNADTSITRAIYIQNSDIYKHSTPGGIPSPYNTEFTLDNNDGLIIIESNDYNSPTEHFQIQGLQILQSANGLTGSAIDLNKAIGSGGGSTDAPLVQFDPTDNDVLKITDIGFVQTTSGTQDAHLDFSFKLVDGDGDMTALQHLFTNFVV
jgi:hypothetical protein